ncbi:HNH endonuclease [Spirulina sp. 06S082]|uniref:HNH endonuclease n=1 Tax=Spirulina sp. 06S082 TaxID=3110248 RepID=UPI002B20CDCD|nr:HNH endonuclease [Spirulina sp. 06S082]MEA5467512.1 HNH endonuclease [Spirulina sp. 06S082]
MKKPHNWNNLVDLSDECDCPYAYIVAYYLSRFDRNAYQKLGFGNMTETHKKIASILNLSTNTIKNFRDAFDPYHENPRRGWWQRELWRFEKEVYEGFKAYSEEDINTIIQSILDRPKRKFKELFDPLDPDAVEVQNQKATENKFILEEGKLYEITLTRHERNPKARKQCLKYYGTDCCICGFNFEQVFGEIGKDFIQVHHLLPLSAISQEYEVDPINDLRPVCPNCHAMIHKNNPPFTIEEIKNLLN